MATLGMVGLSLEHLGLAVTTWAAWGADPVLHVGQKKKGAKSTRRIEVA